MYNFFMGRILPLSIVLIGGLWVFAALTGHFTHHMVTVSVVPKAEATEVTEGVVVASGWANHSMSVWEDPSTGCRYLIRGSHNGSADTITPRMTRSEGNYHQEGCTR